MIRSVPAQSMLRRPARRGVFADSTLRKKRRIAKDTPPIGTGYVSIFLVVKWSPTVQIEAPTPGDARGKGTPDDWAQGTGNGPGHAEESVVHWAFPETSV